MKEAYTFGILGSKDIVAVDKASMDLISERVNNKRLFLDMHNVDPNIMIDTAQQIEWVPPTTN